MSNTLMSLARRMMVMVCLMVWVVPAWAKPKHVLVVTVTKGFRHSSIPTGEKVIASLAEQSKAFTVEYARVEPTDPQFKGADGKPDNRLVDEAIARVLAQTMSMSALKKYDAVIFENTTGVLPVPDKEGFLNWIKSGKGFIGMHSASDCFHAQGQVDPFIDMLGGEFNYHGAQVKVECINQDPKHPANRHFGPTFSVFDEIYVLKNFNRGRVHGLLTLDKHPNSGAPGDYPVSWVKEFGKGRVFYTSLGHREDVWESEPYQKHILGGIKWALGLEKGNAKPQELGTRLGKEEIKAGFRPLFNGVDLTGWKLRNPSGRPSWSAQNGMLVNTIDKDKDGKDIHGSDLLTEEKFQDFTVRYEFMVPKSSNSGFYLRGRYEVQVYDDYGSTTPDLGGNGAIYSVKAPDAIVSRKPGEWQEAEVTIRGKRITVVLNGRKIQDNVEVNRATGGELDRNYEAPGPIFLQGDHGAVAFRNIRIKTLN